MMVRTRIDPHKRSEEGNPMPDRMTIPEGDAFSYIRENVARLCDRLADVAREAGVPVPRLIPVTKSATPEEFLALSRIFPQAAAENRVQAWRERVELLEAAGLPSPEWHLIGSLQVNKVKYVSGKVALIQSADSEKLIREIGRVADNRGVRQDILLEVNSGREPDKGGVLPEDAAALAEFARTVPGVRLVGLMTMGPVLDDPDDYRPFFSLTRELSEKLAREGLFETDRPVLSMGMSGSWIPAVREGATMVRVGRALFRREQN